MKKPDYLNENVVHRAAAAVIAVLPRSVNVQIVENENSPDIVVNGQPLSIKWAGKGNLGDVRLILSMCEKPPDIVVASKLSPGARNELLDAGVNWVDETGTAEIAIGQIIVSRTGSSQKTKMETTRWNPSVMAVTEAILTGVKATISDTGSATGLSEGSCTNALRFLTNQGLLKSAVKRGPKSARRIIDERMLLDAYVDAIEKAPLGLSLQVGIVGRDLVSRMVEVGKTWSNADISWASTGLIAANAIAPLITSVNSAEVYVSAKTIIGLEAVAKQAELMPIEGGRLTLRPFPAVSVRTMSKKIGGIRVAPWPRVYADLLQTGVRGEDAAEHLLEVIHDR